MRTAIRILAGVCLVAILAQGDPGWGGVPSGSVVGWGWNTLWQCDPPDPNTGFVAVAAGSWHSLGLTADGSIVGWGACSSGECDTPSPNTGFVAVSAGYWHSLGLKSDGSIVAWGDNWYGQCNVPVPNSGYVAVAGGYGWSMGLRSDGSIAAWGDNTSGECNVPEPNSGFAAIAAGRSHGLGLKTDGSIVAWGDDAFGAREVPSPNANFIAVAARDWRSMGLKSDGSIIPWGDSTAPHDIPGVNADFVAMAAGQQHSLGLKSDGTIVAWGDNGDGQCDVPAPNERFVAISAGERHSLAVRRAAVPIFVMSFKTEIRDEGVLISWRVSDVADAAAFRLIARLDALEWEVPVEQAGDDGYRALDRSSRLSPNATVTYRLELRQPDGSWRLVRDLTLTIAEQPPAALAITAVAPNPFNPRTSILYDLPRPGHARLSVYDLRGARVSTLVDADLPGGHRSVDWDGRDGRGLAVPSGVYVVRLETRSGVCSTRITVAR